MPVILRHLLSILLLPFMVTVVVPRWLLAMDGAALSWRGASAVDGLSRAAGAVVFAVGFALFAWCVLLFARVGQGTLAPWDPTRRLVAVGPYRHVRNPMISGVLLMLVGEALQWRSGVLALWAGTFLLMNHAYFLLSEEPGMEKRFGESYRVYRSNVPRWIPRVMPWAGESAITGRSADERENGLVPREFGSAHGLIHMADDFDEPLEDSGITGSLIAALSTATHTSAPAVALDLECGSKRRSAIILCTREPEHRARWLASLMTLRGAKTRYRIGSERRKTPLGLTFRNRKRAP